MKLARWLVPLVSLLVVLWLTWLDTKAAGTGPGPVHSAHGKLAEIAGGSRCEACHQVGAGLDAAACTRCHEPIGEQLRDQEGLHGKLAGDTARHCELCHSDHHGDDVPLIASYAFARAGVGDVGAYDHAHVPFTLDGVHRGLACTKCHEHADAPAPPAGGRYLGLSQRCTSCHDDPHRGAFGGECASCHGQQQPWGEVPHFVHDSFPLADAHAKVACSACHAVGTPFDVAAEKARPQPPRACSGCHANPHGEADRPATALILPGALDCQRCHDATTWDRARPTPERHADYSFALRGDHATTDCAACHGNAQRAPRWNGAGPRLAECAACHQHPHTSALVQAATAVVGPANGCADCHEDADADFAIGRISPAQHAVSGFELVPPHADVACAKCHLGATPQGRFPGRDAADCRVCHTDVHQGQFAHEARFAQCSACHAGAHFVPSTFGPVAHASTRWPLTGAHEAVGCSGCHQKGQDQVQVFHGTSTRCADCHRDVHDGAFDRAGRPQTVAGRAECARCHDSRAFAPVVADFDHRLWTGHALAGAHQKVDCHACHPALVGKDGMVGKRLGPAAGTSCASCHQDPHAGQFVVAGTTDCRRCHAESTWQELRFDHGRDSRFALDETHAKLACASCHHGYRVGERTLVRYKPLGVLCGDCHTLGPSGEVRR